MPTSFESDTTFWELINKVLEWVEVAPKLQINDLSFLNSEVDTVRLNDYQLRRQQIKPYVHAYLHSRLQHLDLIPTCLKSPSYIPPIPTWLQDEELSNLGRIPAFEFISKLFEDVNSDVYEKYIIYYLPTDYRREIVSKLFAITRISLR